MWGMESENGKNTVQDIIRKLAVKHARTDQYLQEDLCQEAAARAWRNGLVDDHLRLKPDVPESHVVQCSKSAMKNHLIKIGIITKKGRPKKELAKLVDDFGGGDYIPLDNSTLDEFEREELIHKFLWELTDRLTQLEFEILTLRFLCKRRDPGHEGERYSLEYLGFVMAVGYYSDPSEPIEDWSINRVRRLIQTAINKLRDAT